MTITQLHYILSVAEHKNFTVAANHSAVSQPTLSMQIQKLEEELDVQIFDRSKKPISITKIGKKIIAQAKIIVEESKRINDIVDQQKGYVGGVFRLALIPTVMPTLLPIFLKTFSKKYEEVQLIIEEITTEECIKKLAEGHIDAAIAATPLEEENIIEKPLYYEPFVGFVPNSNKLYSKKELCVDTLDANEILLLKDGHCFKDSILNMCSSIEQETSKSFQLQSGSFDTLIKLAKEDLGMTLLPYLHSLDIAKEDQHMLRNFETPVPAREISLLYHKSQLKLKLIETLKNTIDGLVRGAIAFQDVKIISPLQQK
jgi:LysR family transcriptional regulator, hydrogen peroxide-inducible genes activator